MAGDAHEAEGRSAPPSDDVGAVGKEPRLAGVRARAGAVRAKRPVAAEPEAAAEQPADWWRLSRGGGSSRQGEVGQA